MADEEEERSSVEKSWSLFFPVSLETRN